MHVIICGGGIGGLTTALRCLQQGFTVSVVERANAIQEVGAGIQLSPNAMRVFTALGIDQHLKAVAFSPKALNMRDGINGRCIASLALNPSQHSPWGSVYQHIHRADLIQCLLHAAKCHSNFHLYLASTLDNFQHNNTGITAIGQQPDHQPLSLSGDVLVAADGIHSKLRQQITGAYQPQFTGNVAWRFTVPTASLSNPPEPAATVWFGHGKHAVTYRLGDGSLCNFVGVVETPQWTEESWSHQGQKHDARKDFTGWHPTLVEMIEQANSLYLWALMDRPVLPNWSSGRATLLGDACHAMLPFMAQGAAMAIEDAWCLSTQLAQQHTVEAALQAYQTQRIPRVSAVQATATANQAVFHQHGQLQSYFRNTRFWLGSRLSQRLAAKQLDWLYGYDITAQTP